MGLDKLDWAILHELDIDARQSYTKIAKKVKSSREVVRYRMQRMEEQGIIKNYVLLLDMNKLGYDSYKWYMQLEHTDKAAFEKIVRALQEHSKCVWVTSCAGRWDLAIVFFAKSPTHFYELTSAFSTEYGKYIRETTFTVELGVYHFKKKYLGKDTCFAKVPIIGGESKGLVLDKEEKTLLYALCNSPRKSVIELSKETNITPDIIRYRLKKLTMQGVIQGSRVNLNYEKIGFIQYKIFLKTRFSNARQKKSLLTFLETTPHVADVIHSLGNWDMEINVDVKTSKTFYDFILTLKDKFPELITSYDSLQLFTNYKYHFFPMGG